MGKSMKYLKVSVFDSADSLYTRKPYMVYFTETNRKWKNRVGYLKKCEKQKSMILLCQH